MIIILFIGLALVFFLVPYFEKKRKERNDEHHERRRESFTSLLDALRNKTNSTNQTVKENDT